MKATNINDISIMKTHCDWITEQAKEHKAYNEWLRKYADDAILWNEMSGYLMIKAADFIKRIEKMPLDYIRGWLDGENQLEWKPEFKN